jgi:DNA-binding transcriptional ArsR family regulator
VRRTKWSAEVIALIAERFKALSEPARLEILTSLRDGEKTVTQIVDQSGLGQANVSKHLQSLYAAGFVARRKEGLFVYYFLADASVLKLCDSVYDRLEKEIAARRKALSAG